MILNTNPNNKCTAYDLTDTEISKFYRGATLEDAIDVLVDVDNNILRCSDNIPSWQAKEGQKVLTGIFSCNQFCEI